MRRNGFSKDSINLLEDNWVIGTPDPGKDFGGRYFELKRLVESKEINNNKVILEISGNNILRDGKPIQGARIVGENIEFTGYHFTTSKTADLIRNDGFVIKNFEDPYIYFSEPGWFSGKSQNEIRKILGASVAEDVVIVKVRSPLNNVWIKAEPGKPIKIAVDVDIETSNLLKIKGKLIEIRSISDF